MIRVHAATVNLGDCETRELRLPFLYRFLIRVFAGLVRPKRITLRGQEMAGTVVKTENNIGKFRAGDEVFAATGLGRGAYAEYVGLPRGVSAI